MVIPRIFLYRSYLSSDLCELPDAREYLQWIDVWDYPPVSTSTAYELHIDENI